MIFYASFTQSCTVKSETRPMLSLFSNNYLSRKPIENAMRRFSRQFRQHQRVLDIGCGHKPYQKFFRCEYIGLDPLSKVQPDIVANAWDVPLPENHVDGIILNQALEHIAKTDQTIQEIYRVLKPGGIIIVTVPHAMKNHSTALPAKDAPVQNFNREREPYWRVDYYRFTKYGLIYAFRKFRITGVDETTGYFGTLFQLMNYFLASFGADPLFMPVYFINNVLGLSADAIFRGLARIPLHPFQKFGDFIYSSLTIDYILTAKKENPSGAVHL